MICARFHDETRQAMLRHRSLPSPLFASLAVAFASLLCAGDAQAVDKAAGASAKPGSLLTLSQLRDCVGRKERLQAQAESALKSKDEIGADKTEIERSGDALKEQLAGVDRTSGEAVEAYNVKVQAHDKAVAAFESKVAAYNKLADGVKASKDAYAAACDNRRYDERDLNDLQRKK